MRIGHYMTGIWDHGGVATYIRRISDAQKELGHEIVFLDLESHRSAESAAALEVQYAPNELSMLRKAEELKLDLLHVHTLVRELDAGKLPVVRTVHGHQPYCPSGSRFLKSSGKPCDRSFGYLGCTWGHVVNRCGSVRPKRFVDDFRRTRLEMHTLKGRCIATVSQFMKAQMVRDGYDSDLVHVLYLPSPPVMEPVPPTKEGVPRFVFLGRLSPQKGVAWLLRALSKTTRPLQVDIAGDGDLGDELRALANALGIEDRVTFHGWVNGAQVNQLIRAARAVVFPSVWHEPGGTVAFEAMANARAVIMSRVGGMPEIVQDQHTGLVVKPNDDLVLARAIEMLADDYTLASTLGNNGRSIAMSKYTLEIHIKSLMKLYSDCIRQHLA